MLTTSWATTSKELIGHIGLIGLIGAIGILGPTTKKLSGIEFIPESFFCKQPTISQKPQKPQKSQKSQWSQKPQKPQKPQIYKKRVFL